MLTGRQLFPPGKDQPQDLVKRARNPRVPAPSSRAPRVPAELDEICLKALAARKEDRYATGDELREALTAVLASEYPQTGASQLESFLSELFAEDIERERKEREELLENIRNRVQTMPSTDELRRALEQAGDLDAGGRRASDSGQLLGVPVIGQSRHHIDVRAPGSVSREAVLLNPPRETSQATPWAVDDHVSGHILAAAGAITGLDMAMPVGSAIRDVPRWSYLAAVVPDLGARLDQLGGDYGLDVLLELEAYLDEKRDGLAELVMGAADPGARAALAEKFSPDMIALAATEPSGEPPWPAGLRWMSGKARGPMGSYFAHYEMALQGLLPPELGRTRADQISTLASMIDGQLPLDCEKVLGAYHPVNHQIILFPWMIELVAKVMGWSASTLERVAILHEASHAMLSDGPGAAGKGWET
jgi:hypothetical protein